MSTSGYGPMYDAVSSFPAQAKASQLDDVATSAIETMDLDGIVFCAMGGSAFPMELFRQSLGVPIVIHRDYGDTLREVSKKKLYVLVSYSGNTEEVLDCGALLIGAEVPLLVVTNGGKLASLAETYALPRLGFPPLPDDFQPRCATGYFLGLVAQMADCVGVTDSAYVDLLSAFKALNNRRSEIESAALSLSQSLGNGILLLVGYGVHTAAVGHIGRIKLNENAKRLALVATLPEFNHNMLEAVCGHPSNVDVLLIHGSGLTDRKRRRLAVTEQTLEDAGSMVHRVELTGLNELESQLMGIWLLDYVSLFLAQASGVDPQSIEAIESFKLELNA